LRVAITRPREKAGETLALCSTRGWDALIVPTVELRPRKKALEGIDLKDFDWLVLTSSSGAEMALKHYKDKAKKVKIACIGPKTAAEVMRRGYQVAFTPTKYEAGALAEELLRKGAEGKRILVARASTGREVLVRLLGTRAEVKEVSLYDTSMVRDTRGIEEFVKALEEGKLDAIIFTSSQAAKNLLSALDDEKKALIGNLRVCAIGPITASALRRGGIKVDAVPQEYTVKGCLDELENLKNPRRD
jgi:uroporphyrinogen-III synthase